MEGEEFGWNEERKDTKDRKGREERIVEDGGRESLRGEESQLSVRRSRKRRVV